MAALRRWVPAPARPPAAAAGLASGHSAQDAAMRDDLAFCAAFAAQGGVAESAEGFSAEPDLVRMQQAGLVDLRRDSHPPFAVTRVALSASGRAILAGSAAPAAAGTVPLVPAPPPAAGPARRNGFEVARGMIGAAIKAEVASWIAQGEPGGPAALERRLMTRVGQIGCPFRP